MKGTFFLLFSAVIMMTYLDYAEALMCSADGVADGAADCPAPTDKSCMADFSGTAAWTCSDMAQTKPCVMGDKFYCITDHCNKWADKGAAAGAVTEPCDSGMTTTGGPGPGPTGGPAGPTTDGMMMDGAYSNKGFSALTLLALSAIPFKVLSN